MNTTISLKHRLTSSSLIALTGLLLASNIHGAITFEDDFSDGLAQWHGGSGGVVVSDPTYGQALTFNRTYAGGDIESLAAVSVGEWLSFDYRGIGGFIGTGVTQGDVKWLAGQAGYAVDMVPLVYDDTWRHYSCQVLTAGSIWAEIWSYGPGYPGSAFFANIVVADSPVPEPPTALAGAASLIGIICCLVRRRSS